MQHHHLIAPPPQDTRAGEAGDVSLLIGVNTYTYSKYLFSPYLLAIPMNGHTSISADQLADSLSSMSRNFDEYVTPELMGKIDYVLGFTATQIDSLVVKLEPFFRSLEQVKQFRRWSNALVGHFMRSNGEGAFDHCLGHLVLDAGYLPRHSSDMKIYLQEIAKLLRTKSQETREVVDFSITAQTVHVLTGTAPSGQLKLHDPEAEALYGDPHVNLSARAALVLRQTHATHQAIVQALSWGRQNIE